ncbi:diguanylate cyclase domain-containing protein [Fundidesulfovibrio soli]|uniref:diguanylate cyclase domain-containing protein n=1 Tax=Fundidesulfovibrio soli TaxID=2922716 RepID=UPI001FAF5941|nr:diguanylate cyclase [Fundidesulfovibrio soli]
MKLRTKATLLLSGLVLAVVAGTSLFLLNYQKAALRQVVFDGLVAEAEGVANDIRKYMEGSVRDTEAIAANLPLDALAASDIERLRAYLRLQLRLFPQFENGLFLLSPSGIFLADYPAHPELEGESFAYREYYQGAVSSGRAVLSPPYLSARTALPVMTVAAPVFAPGGKLLGLVCASLNLFSPHALSEGGRRMSKGGYVYVVSASGQFLMHPERGRIFTSLSLGQNLFLDKVLQGYEGVGETVNSKGVDMLIASRKVPELGWHVLAQVGVKEAFANLDEALVAVGVFFIAVLALVIPAGLLAMRRIARPLEALEAAAQIISQDLQKPGGALTRPFASSALDALRKMRSNDEIGKLARAFFHLSVRLKQTLASLRGAAEDWERTFNSVQEALLVLDANGRVLRVNRVTEDLFRLPLRDIVSKHWRDVLAGGAAVPEDWPGMEILRDSGRIRLTTVLPRQQGLYELNFSPVAGRRGGKGYLLVITDVTEKTRSEERIRELAFHDGLTGLPNRLLLADRLEQAIATAERNQTKVGVLFLDLDEFKRVNDTHGHVAGDELLRRMARRLGACLRANDTLARYSGDEFVAVLIDLVRPDEAAAIATRMLEAAAEPFEIGGTTVRVGASIGIAISPQDGSTANQLLNHADTAMYRAKGRGKNNFWFADASTASNAYDHPEQ